MPAVLAEAASGAAHLRAPAASSTPVDAPMSRAVPVPVGALTQLLDMDPMARSRLRHLALVESSCRMSSADGPFARLPPRAAEIAIRQLDTVLPQHPALRVLRLQLERHLHAHKAHVAAMLAVEDRKWRIEGAVPGAGRSAGAGPVAICDAGLARDSMIGGPWGVTDFLDTQPIPQEQAADLVPG